MTTHKLAKIEIGKHLTDYKFSSDSYGGFDLLFQFSDGSKLVLLSDHDQDCCESVTICDTEGNPRELIGTLVISKSIRFFVGISDGSVSF